MAAGSIRNRQTTSEPRLGRMEFGRPGRVAIGVRVLRGQAVAIALAGSRHSPAFAGRALLLLSDPKVPSTLRPFHALARLPREEAESLVKRDVAVVRKAAARSVRAFARRLLDAGARVSRLAIVSDSDPQEIDNSHLRAHADERRLFRESIASAARDLGIASEILLDRDPVAAAICRLAIKRTRLNQLLTAISETAGLPWRSDEKTAALAALIALSH